MKPLLRLRVRAEETPTLFARVLVWPTREAMYEYRPLDRDHLGSCTPWQQPGDRCFAEVCLFRDAVGSTVLSHEMFHASLAWARRVGVRLDQVSDDGVTEEEERVAHAHSDMVRQLVDRLYAAGMYE